MKIKYGKNIIKNLKAIRLINNMTQAEFAKKIGTTQRVVSYVENSSCINLSYIIKVMKMFNVSEEQLCQENMAYVGKNMKYFNTNLRNLRTQCGISQNDLADYIGTSSSMVSHLETGKRRPNKQTIDKIAKLFKTSPAKLITEKM